MKLIDFHTHCFADELADRALEVMFNGLGILPSFDGRLKNLIKLMDAAEVDISVILPVATKPSQVQPINDWVAEIKNPRIITFGAMHRDFPEPEKELDRMEEMGIRGIKFQPNFQGFRPDDARMYPIYEAMEGRFIALFHSGDELQTFPHQLSPPEAMANVHGLYPKLTMVLAHMGGYQMWDEVETWLLGRDVYFDVSCCLPDELPDSRFVDLIRAQGAERILFGSDAPCCNPTDQFQRIMSLPLTDEEKELIFWKNAARLLEMDDSTVTP